MARKYCVLCENEIPTFSSCYKLKDGVICPKCYKKNQKVMPMLVWRITGEELKDKIDPSRINFRNHGYEETFEFGRIKGDENKQVIFFPDTDNEVMENRTLFSLKEVYRVEIIEDNQTVSSGGLGAAVVGDVLLGGVGAIIGSNVGKKKSRGTCAKLSVKIYLDNPMTQYKEVYFINEQKKPVKKDSDEYKQAYQSVSELEAKLQYYIRKNQTK